MIGTDIIDLTVYQGKQRSKNPLFVNKVLRSEELAYCASKGLDPETFLWSSWAAKESAYKVFARQLATPFTPKKFTCHFTDGNHRKGTVMSPYGTCYFHLDLKNDYLCCTAYQFTTFPFINRHFHFKDTAHADIRANLHAECCNYLAAYFSISKAQIRVQHNDNGSPILACPIVEEIPQVSFSHHGSYGSFALVFPSSSLGQRISI